MVPFRKLENTLRSSKDTTRGPCVSPPHASSVTTDWERRGSRRYNLFRLHQFSRPPFLSHSSSRTLCLVLFLPVPVSRALTALRTAGQVLAACPSVSEPGECRGWSAVQSRRPECIPQIPHAGNSVPPAALPRSSLEALLCVPSEVLGQVMKEEALPIRPGGSPSEL